MHAGDFIRAPQMSPEDSRAGSRSAADAATPELRLQPLEASADEASAAASAHHPTLTLCAALAR